MPGFGRIFQQIVQLFFGLLDWDRPGKPPFVEKEILRALQDGIVVFVQLLTAAEKVQIAHDLADRIETPIPQTFGQHRFSDQAVFWQYFPRAGKDVKELVEFTARGKKPEAAFAAAIHRHPQRQIMCLDAVKETLPTRDFLFVDLNDFSWPKRPMDYLVAYFKIHTSLLI